MLILVPYCIVIETIYRIAGNIGWEFILANWQFSHELPNYDSPILLHHSDVIHCGVSDCPSNVGLHPNVQCWGSDIV